MTIQRNLTILLLLVLTAFIIPASAFCQGFMVKPMKMEAAPSPGQNIVLPLSISNTGGDKDRTVEVQLVELTQAADATFSAMQPNTTGTAELSSCLPWVTLSAKELTVPALETGTINVAIRVPPGSYGTHSAALIVCEKMPKVQTNERQLQVAIQFLVPIILDIQGRIAPQAVSLGDMGMEFIPRQGTTPPSTKILFGLDNKGKTFSRFNARLRLQIAGQGGRMRTVASVDFKSGIMPGSKLNMDNNLKRNLPSGNYTLECQWSIDGKPMPVARKQLAYQGDPSVNHLTMDAALALDPEEINIEGTPGAARTALVKITNTSPDSVIVTPKVVIPESLRLYETDEFKGPDLSCAKWVSITPARQAIAGGGQATFRIAAQIPKDGPQKANYYTNLILNANSTDGQDAGTRTTMISVQNPQLQATPRGQIEKLQLVEDQEETYLVKILFNNVGPLHIIPSGKVGLYDGLGKMINEQNLVSDNAPLLPLAKKELNGITSFRLVEPGIYALRVNVNYAPGKNVSQQLRVKVAREDGKKIVTVLAPGEEAPQSGSAAEASAAQANPATTATLAANPAMPPAQ